MRQTKIIATVGPVTDQPDVTERMIASGVDLFRFNLAHGEPSDHLRRAQEVLKQAKTHGRTVGLIAELQGPKPRIGRFREGSVELSKNDRLVLDTFTELGDATRVGMNDPRLLEEVEHGTTLLIEEGRIAAWVEEVREQELLTRIVQGGVLSDNQSLTRAGGGLPAGGLTEKDQRDLRTAAEMGVDYLVVPFHKAEEVPRAQELLEEANGSARLIAKIDHTASVAAVDDLLEATHAIMIARGDLGPEIGDIMLPSLQRRVIHQARRANKAVIISSQMFTSLLYSPIPSSQEVTAVVEGLLTGFDSATPRGETPARFNTSSIANAVLDGSDAVLFTGRVATHDHPVDACTALDQICQETEGQVLEEDPDRWLGFETGEAESVSGLVAQYALGFANRLEAAALIAFIADDQTALSLSRGGAWTPIYAFSAEPQVRRQATLCRGVYPLSLPLKPPISNTQELFTKAIELLHQQGAIYEDDWVVITADGSFLAELGATSTLELVKIGESVH